MPTSAYDLLWRSVSARLVAENAAVDLHFPQRYGLVSGLSGRFTLDMEIAAVVDFVDQLGASPVWLAGHSRGGAVAWQVADQLGKRGFPVSGLCVVDPVGASGPPVGDRSQALRRLAVDISHCCLPVVPRVVVLGGPSRCAPSGFGPDAFVANYRPLVEHVLADGRHMDVISGRARLLASLCGRAADPSATRERVAQLLADWLVDRAWQPDGIRSD